MMRKCFLALLAICFYLNLTAQTPQSIPYQAIARDAAGNAFANRGLEIRFTIIDSVVTGSVVYQEKHTTVTTSLGLFTLNVGQGLASIGSFANVKWSKNAKFLQVEMDTLSAGNWVNLGTQQMLSVPYALYAEKAGNSYTHYVGELYGGGIIFHLFRDINGAEHGLICSLKDLSTAQVWSNKDTTLIGSSAQSDWDGKSNTYAIIHQAGHTTSAALLCDTFTGGGFTDWYLPALQEMNMLGSVKYDLNRVLTAVTGANLLLSDAPFYPYYPTSTESSNNGIYLHRNANAGLFSLNNKNNKFYVRAVRSF